MDAMTAVEPLSRIGADVDEQVLKVIRHIVAARRAADDPQAIPAARMLAMSLGKCNDPGQTPDPYNFARSVLPFWHWTNPSVGKHRGLIPLDRTVGHSWKWQPRLAEEIAHGRDIEAFRTFLLHSERAAGQALSRAEAAWIRPLGLFMMHEGKNRIAFLAAEGESWMPAQVTEFSYPPAADLTLYEVDEAGSSVFVCVRQNRHAVILANPAWTLPILEAYGVKRGARLERADEVLVGIRRGELDVTGRLTAPACGFDMKRLPTAEEMAYEAREQLLVSHENLKVSNRSIFWPWMTMTALLVIGGLLARNGLPSTFLEWSGSVLLVGACGALAGFWVCLHRVRVTVVDMAPVRMPHATLSRNRAADGMAPTRRLAG
jgi:hypothetical protein